MPAHRTAVRRAAGALLLLAATGGLLVGCSGGDDLEGTIRVTGSSTVRPILSTVAGRFASEHPFVTFDLDAPGTADGFTLFCDGLADITGASRPMNERERAECESSRIEWVELVVGVDAIAVFTSTTSPAVNCLTTAQLYAATGPESQGRATWASAASLAAEIDPAAGTALDSLASTPLRVIGPGQDSGTHATFVDLAIAATAATREKAAALRSDLVSPAGSQVIINQVGSTQGSIGFLGLSALSGTEQIVQPIALDAGDGCVELSIETVSDGSYPLTRQLYVYVARNANGSVPPAIAGLVDYLLTDEGFDLAAEAGGLRLDDESIAEVRSSWETASGR